MSSLSFVSSVAARPVAAPARAARKAVSTEVKAIGGFGPNMPADEYRQKMEAKKALIAANKCVAPSTVARRASRREPPRPSAPSNAR